MVEDRSGLPPHAPTRVVVPAALALLVASVVARPGLAQAPGRGSSKFYPDTSTTAETLLRNADNQVKGGQYAEAIEIYQRVIEKFGDKVVEVPPIEPKAGERPGAVAPGDSTLFVDARLDCQRRIAGLPPEGRAIYRARVDGQAERWYAQGAEARDRATLRRVVEQAFCSSWGDDALELLGDLSFQEGQFVEALASYRQLVPDPAIGGRGPVHPDPSVDLAKVAAKKLLCRAALGDPPTAADLEAYAKAYPGAGGDLAGRKGDFAEILPDALKQDWSAVAAPPDARWPTFAGSPTRSRVAPGAVDVGSLQWRIELPKVDVSGRPPRFAARNNFSSPNLPPDRLLAYHPIVLGDQVIVADPTRGIRAFNLNDRPADAGGTLVKEAWITQDPTSYASEAARPYPTLPRFTLTAFGDRVYVRLGATQAANFAVMGGMGGRINYGGGGASDVVAIDRAAEGKLLWAQSASKVPLPRRRAEVSSRNAMFEGTPVADARGVYVALTDRVDNAMTATYVACLDPEAGAVRWVRYVGESSPGAHSNPAAEISHRLLTLDGPTLFYQTNLGALAALDVETGGIRWLASYPWSGGRDTFGQERDLNPAVSHDGLVIIAPDDSPALFAYDAATGRMAWKTRPLPEEVKLAHLLGVAKGHVIATGDRVVLFDVKTGEMVGHWPDGGQSIQGFGRGLLAGDKIYWPTRTDIHILSQETGLRAEPSIRLQEAFQVGGGNLAVGDGFLVVTQADSMVVFCQNRRLIERYRDEIARAPERASSYFRLAQAAEASGQDDLALSSLEQVFRRAGPSETIDGQPLAESARDRQYRLLLRQGEAARKKKDWASASARFARAAEVARSDRDRLASRLDLADAQLRDGRPGVAATTLQGLLADERLRPQVVAAGDGHRSVRADLLIADRLAAIVREHGRGAYAAFDRAAEGLLERGAKGRDPGLLADVGRSYPAARAVPEALLALGRLHDREGRHQESARAYKRLLAADAPDPIRARAAWGLARSYEARRLLAPAREAYLQAAARFGDQQVEDYPDKARLVDLVAARLARDPFLRMAGESAEPDLPMPVARRWGRQWPATIRPLAADGTPPSAEQGRIFLVEGTTLRAVDPTTGEPSWGADLGSEPVWAGYLADRLLAATKSRLVALRLDGGAVAWQSDLGPGGAKPPATPFARPEGADPKAEPAGPLQGFRVVGGRLICLRSDRAILAIDGDSGQVDWSYAPPADLINPRLCVGPNRIVLQVGRQDGLQAWRPSAVVVLDTATGRRRGEFAQNSEAEEWPREPLPIDDDHVAVVADRRTVALLDLARGQNAWTFRESNVPPTYGPPRLIGDAERLLVLHNGMELIRLDPAGGSKRWSRPLGDENLSERPEAFALGGDRFYYATGTDLVAVGLADGATAWRKKLIGPTTGWSVALTDRCVAAYPNPSRHQPEDEQASLPLVFRRRSDGELVQRLSFPAPATELTVRLAPRGAYVATQAGLWAYGDRPEAARP